MSNPEVETEKIVTTNIYGITVRGVIVREHQYTVILQEESGERHVVRKEEIGDMVPPRSRYKKGASFDREKTKKTRKQPAGYGERKIRQF